MKWNLKMSREGLQLLGEHDPEVALGIAGEILRQENELELIASENAVSLPVMAAQGSVATNKYAEGYPRARWYGGCRFVDVLENLARSRGKQLFGCDRINVQPHAGAQANQAAYVALGMEPGDRLLGMDLSHGGHLTHGSPVNSSGKLFDVDSYGVDDETGRIDMDAALAKARAHKPKVIMVGASAYPRFIDFEAWRAIADEVDALLAADIAHIAAQVAMGLHPDPIPHCHLVTSTTHKTLRGPRGGIIMCGEDLIKAVNSAVFPGNQGGPLQHVIAAKAVAFGEALKPEFRTYVRQYLANSKALAQTLMYAGIKLVSDGTDNHLMLVDLARTDGCQTLTGKAASKMLGRARITVNKNTVPGEQRSPFQASGIRIGTPTLTTRGMRTNDMRTIGGWIVELLEHPDDEARQARIAGEVQDLCTARPLYPALRDAARYVVAPDLWNAEHAVTTAGSTSGHSAAKSEVARLCAEAGILVSTAITTDFMERFPIGDPVAPEEVE